MIKLQPTRLKTAEFERTIYAVSPEDGTKFEGMLHPAYWANVAQKFKTGDRIEVTAENGDWFAELMVVASARLWAKVVPLRFVELSAAPIPAHDSEAPSQDGPDTKDFEVGYAGVKAKWRVVRKADKQTMRGGFQTKNEAEKWLDDYVKAIS